MRRTHARQRTPYRAGPGAGTLRHWDAAADSPDPHARRGFDYYAFKAWPVARLELSFPAELAQDVGASESEIRRLNDDPPRTHLLEAVARQLLRAEAVASSRIEGLDVSHRRLAIAAFDPEDARGNAHEVLANVRAMEEAIRIAASERPFTLEEIRRIHRRLFEGTRDASRGGVIRDSQNWIGTDPYSPYGADFIPVPETEVRSLLADLCRFVERDDVPPVAQAAIVNGQFETIHPFHDGNGRVGRALIHVVLRRRGLAPRYVPPISVALAANADGYVAGLTAYRADAIAEWMTVFARAVLMAARGAERLAADIDALKGRWRGMAAHPRAGSAADRLIELLPIHPVIDLRSAEAVLGVSDEAARVGIERLASSGVLRETTGRRRSRSWESVGLFALLDQFERNVATPAGSAEPRRRAPRPTR